jgi:hypothetical protein
MGHLEGQTGDTPHVLEGPARRISAHLNRRAALYLILFSAGYFLLAIAEARARPLWHDELFTAYLVRLPTAGALLDGLASGIDLMPPLYHLILRVLVPILGDSPVVLRMPSIVGFWVMCLCLYRFVSRRLPAEFGFAAMLVPLCTRASYFMVEARPYGLVLGLGALALVAWQALDVRSRLRPMWLGCLILSLSAAIAAHHYAVLLLVPLMAGELVRSMARRSVDWLVVLCITGATLMMLPLSPFLRVAREFAPTFWTLPTVGVVFSLYNDWLAHSDWVFVALGLIAALAWFRWPSSGAPSLTLPAPDVVAAMMMLALPAVGAVAAYVMGAGVVARYVMPGIIGFSIVMSFGLARMFGHSHALRLLMLCALLLNHEILFRSRDLLAAAPEPSVAVRMERRFLELGDSTTPVLVASPHHFLELLYYSPKLAGRLHYVADAELAFKHFETATADRALILLSRVVPIPVGLYPADLPTASGYYLIDGAPLNWLARELVAGGTTPALVTVGHDFVIYRVDGSGGKR